MPIRKVPGTDVQYYLIVFDEKGKERPEPDGTLLSENVRQRVADPAAPVTDVFFTSHGWKGDVPGAIEQYDAWIGTMEKAESDRLKAREQRPGFTPLIVGLHWPSLPWGDESVTASGGGVLSAGDELAAPIDAQVDAYASRIADSPKARSAIRTILEAASRDHDATTLSPQVRAAYDTLFAESGLASGDKSGRPGADQEGFDAAAIIADAQAGGGQAGTAGGTPGVLGFRDKLRDALVMPLRQLSFWKMKDRARSFGESGGHDLLATLQQAAPNARFHLMGHSFGCIVVSATVAGAPNGQLLPRPVDSIFLVQGALSLWSYASDIPYAPGTAGYFNRILMNGLVRGPIVTTRSTKDTAVGRLYPWGAKLKKQLLLGDSKYPEYGGIGAFGIQGLNAASDMLMQSASYAYNFSGGRVYNLEASGIIKNGGGASGAHSDIAHPEVAHAFWSAVLVGAGTSPGPPPSPPVQPPPPLPGSVPGTLSPPPPPPPEPTASPREATPSGSRRATRSTRKLARDVDMLGRSRGTRSQPGLLGVESEPGPDATVPPPRPTTRAKPPAPAPPASPTTRAEPPVPRPPVAAETSAEPSAPPEPEEKRWFNAELEDHAPKEPLVAGKGYTLAFDVDVAQRETAIASAPAPNAAELFPEGVEAVELTVQLDSDDFKISDKTRPLHLPRVGRSRGKARFDITPLHKGASTIKATIHKEGNFIQQMELTFDVGATRPTAVEVTARGRPPSAASVVHPRDVGLSISPAATGGYDCVVWGSVSSRARLTIQQGYLSTAIEAARQELMKIVMYQDTAGDLVFQTGIDIADADNEVALRTMARAGALLFKQIFFGPGAGADSKAVGEWLRKMASNKATQLKLQILAESTPVPWGLLYVGDASAGAKLDWDYFLGMRHIIEQIPLQNTLAVSDYAIPSDKPELTVSVNVNSGIDAQMGSDFVAQQQTFWSEAKKSRKRIRVTPRTTSTEVVKALADGNTDDQVVYFYCHAASTGLTAPGGPGASCLVLTDASITLSDLTLDAPTSTQLRGNPLVFINACESADLSPSFYDGFVPYFMDKGARGVVGTECKTPALFAVKWAKRFFERFLDGEPLGETFLNLRREFLDQHGNPLGLLYAVHCDGDTQIEPALAANG